MHTRNESICPSWLCPSSVFSPVWYRFCSTSSRRTLCHLSWTLVKHHILLPLWLLWTLLVGFCSCIVRTGSWLCLITVSMSFIFWTLSNPCLLALCSSRVALVEGFPAVTTVQFPDFPKDYSFTNVITCQLFFIQPQNKCSCVSPWLTSLGLLPHQLLWWHLCLLHNLYFKAR